MKLPPGHFNPSSRPGSRPGSRSNSLGRAQLPAQPPSNGTHLQDSLLARSPQLPLDGRGAAVQRQMGDFSPYNTGGYGQQRAPRSPNLMPVASQGFQMQPQLQQQQDQQNQQSMQQYHQYQQQQAGMMRPTVPYDPNAEWRRRGYVLLFDVNCV